MKNQRYRISPYSNFEPSSYRYVMFVRIHQTLDSIFDHRISDHFLQLNCLFSIESLFLNDFTIVRKLFFFPIQYELI
jgi:hypothetical protein